MRIFDRVSLWRNKNLKLKYSICANTWEECEFYYSGWLDAHIHFLDRTEYDSS